MILTLLLSASESKAIQSYGEVLRTCGDHLTSGDVIRRVGHHAEAVPSNAF